MKTNPAPASASQAVAPDGLRPVKAPIELPNYWLWGAWTVGVTLLLAAAAYAWWRARTRKRLPPLLAVIPPHTRARQHLEEALTFISDANRFCTRVAHAIRVYLEERFDLRAPERTTDEFLVELSASPHLTPDQKQSLGMFLQSCDLVKFARFEPTETSLRQLHDSALRLIDETQFEAILPGPTPVLAPAPPATPPPLAAGS
jgi:hypothetical protein